jgi:AbrB family looped-hinge helix DNA binding protein
MKNKAAQRTRSISDFYGVTMQTVTVSEQGQVIIPIDIRKQLGITPGCQLDMILEGSGLRIEVKQRIKSTRPEDGYGLLVCKQPGERHLAEFDVAQAK